MEDNIVGCNRRNTGINHRRHKSAGEAENRRGSSLGKRSSPEQPRIGEGARDLGKTARDLRKTARLTPEKSGEARREREAPGTAENRRGSSRSWEDSSRSEEDSSIDAGKKLENRKNNREKLGKHSSQKFKSRDELVEWTQNTAYSLGYVIVTRRSKAYVNDFVYKVILICDRGREYKATNTIRVFGSKKINCNFQLEGKYSKEYNHWMFKVICDEHNHPPAQHLEGHPYARRLSADETRLVADLTRKNVTPRNILSTLKEQNKNNVSGYLIASKFRVIVHCLSHEQSMTCFPLWKGPEECQPHRTITLVNVNGNHYMSVFLKENYPMPPTTPYWNAHRNSSASAWKAMYRSRFELYNQLTSRSFVSSWINIDD
ncbi:hypothetical protein LXL04_012129 [Taraxacum kok-saghyz]